MQTRCPQCGTRFRVTESQIDAADGYVRCGICEEIFNVNEVAEQVSEEHDHPLPLNSSEQIEEAAVNSASEIPQTDDYDFFEENSADLLEHVVPEEFREKYNAQPDSAISTIFWSFGIIVLTAVLSAQYAWFNRNELIKIPEIQAELTNLCQTFDCKNIPIRAPSKIELVSRNVYSHPARKHLLMVNLTMKNTAKFSQPYPVMSIIFSDIRGNAVASRNFFPDEYLIREHHPDPTEQQDLLQPDTSTSITMEIIDPGKQAMTYEFEFL